MTGYKFFNRYRECGLTALNDRSRRCYRHANKLPFQVERTIPLPKWFSATMTGKP